MASFERSLKIAAVAGIVQFLIARSMYPAVIMAVVIGLFDNFML